jgi:hypothetical protein
MRFTVLKDSPPSLIAQIASLSDDSYRGCTENSTGILTALVTSQKVCKETKTHQLSGSPAPLHKTEFTDKKMPVIKSISCISQSQWTIFIIPGLFPSSFFKLLTSYSF